MHSVSQPSVPELHMTPEELTKNIREGVHHFRILIIGNANAGKTTILEKVCNARGQKPIIRGQKVPGLLFNRAFLLIISVIPNYLG
jgi:GTP-binding protein EngB required for normal cell division